MVELTKYLYCIIPCQQNRFFDGVGLGNEDGLVHTVCHQGLAAVVSDSPVKQYESTRRNMMAHERVLEAVMKETTLLPVRFGTLTDAASPVKNIKKLLESRFEEFHRLLKDMEGKAELGLKAFWCNEKTVYEEIVAENADIRRLRKSLLGKSPEAIRFEGIPLGRMVKEALDRKRSQEAARILLPLQSIAQRVRENDVFGDRMVVNAAFLVDRSQEPEFDRAVSKLDEQFGGRVTLKYIGSAPPYNFVNIVVDWKELN